MKGRKLFCLSALSACILSSYSANAFETDSIESFNIWHSEDVAEKGLALGELTLRKPSKENPILVINDSKVLFNDSGRDGDKKEGDGIYSAFIPFSFGGLLEDLVKKSKSPESLGKITEGLISFPVFSQRGIVKDEELASHLKSILENPHNQKKFELLKNIGSGFEKIPAKDLSSKLGVDLAATPIVSVKIRPNLSSIVNIIDMPLEVFTSVLPQEISVPQSLMITNVNVVEDSNRTFDTCKPSGSQGNPNGVWSFGYLMAQMAQGTGRTPVQYITDWLNIWNGAPTVNGFSVPARSFVRTRIMNSWQRASGVGMPLDAGKFPARLLAITNRPDVGIGGSSYSGGLRRGETRFTFAIIEKTTSGCNTIPMTVIFEYNTPTNTCNSIVSWQQRWKNLDLLTLGSSGYKSALELITRDVTDFGKNPTSSIPNKNLLAQLRTNEKISTPNWELREHRFATSGGLSIASPMETPDLTYHQLSTNTSDKNAFATYVNSFTSTTWAGIPLNFPSNFSIVSHRNKALRAGSAIVRSDNLAFHWNYTGSSFNPEFRRKHVSLNTCTACHTGETKTRFTHIGDLESNTSGANLRTINTEAKLSRFLTGSSTLTTLASFNPLNQFSVVDPAASSGSNWPMSFNDLAERQRIMAEDVLSRTCITRNILTDVILPVTSISKFAVH